MAQESVRSWLASLFHPFPVSLTRPLELANGAARSSWIGCDFVELDTWHAPMLSAGGNSLTDRGGVVDALGRCWPAPQRAGLCPRIHQAGKDGNTLRGSTAFKAAARDRLSHVNDVGGLTTLGWRSARRAHFGITH